MNERNKAIKESLICIDQIFIKTSECIYNSQTLKIVVNVSGKRKIREIKRFMFNKPKKLDIELCIKRLPKESTPVHVDVFIDGQLFTEFDFVFERDTLTSLYHYKDDKKYFVRINIRAFTKREMKFQIGTLHEYEMCDFEGKSIEFIGEGGFGQVLKAREKFSHKIVALKCLSHYDIRDSSNPAIREFLPFISMPHHPNMVEIYGFMFYDCSLFLVLEYFQMGSLADILSPKNMIFELKYFPKVLYGMLNCLHYMHSFGFVHRDISSSNIMISDDNECKVIDFSITRGEDEDELSRDRGKGSYMAPEVSSGEKYDKSIDYYSASVIINEIVRYYMIMRNNSLIRRGICNFELFYSRMEPQWIKLHAFSYNASNNVIPEERLSFCEMCLLIESIFDDDITVGFIKKLSYYELYPFSLEKLHNLSCIIIQNLDGVKQNQIILEFLSELIRIGLNDSSQFDFNNINLRLMMIGGIALDLDILIPQKLTLDQNSRFDYGRLIYYVNTLAFSVNNKSSYHDCFLEFDENLGFHTGKYINNINVDQLLILVLLYHEYGIATMENDSNNQLLNQVITILNNGLLGEIKLDFIIPLLEKYEKCGIEEINQSIYAALADAGYINMAVLAWKSFINQPYGYNKAIKYLKLAMDNGDEESQLYYEKMHSAFDNQKNFDLVYNLRSTLNCYREGNISKSLYYFMFFMDNVIGNSWKTSLALTNLNIYYTALGLMAKENGKIKDYQIYLSFCGININQDGSYFPNNKESKDLMLAATKIFESFKGFTNYIWSHNNSNFDPCELMNCINELLSKI